LPKRGFKNPFRVEAHPVNIGRLADLFDAGEIDVEAMKLVGLVPQRVKVVKVLGTGDVGKKLLVRAHRFSKSAIDKIEKAGGRAERIDSSPITTATVNRAPSAE